MRVLFLALVLACAAPALAQDVEECRSVRFSDLGEHELIIRTAVAAIVLEALGYEPEAQPLSAADTFAALGGGEIDVFLGADPRQHAELMLRAHELGEAEHLGYNRVFASPTEAEDAWALAVSALAENVQESEPEAAAESEAGESGAGDSSIEIATEANVTGMASAGNGDSISVIQETSADSGVESAPEAPASAESPQLLPAPIGIVSMARAGYAIACPNVAVFLGQYSIPQEMVDYVSNRMRRHYEEPFDGAVAWFRDNRDLLDSWVVGMTTFDGQDPVKTLNAEFAF